MLTRLEQAQQKWGGSHSVIDTWLAERQDLLVQYCEIGGASSGVKHEQALPTQQKIQQFCQILMDYISAGHFEIYNDLVKRCEARGEHSLALAQSLYPRITQTTSLAVDFNDKYAEAEQESLLESFDKDLSQLGEALSLRFELEDELIDNLYSHHT